MSRFILALFFFLGGCTKSSPPSTEKKTDFPKIEIPSPQYLSENLLSGQMLVMEDDSVWIINPADQLIASDWIGATAITFSLSDDPDYPYLLTNPDTETRVRAKKGTVQNIP